MRTPLFILTSCFIALCAAAASAQSIDWIARFDDVGAGSDEVSAAVLTSNGALAVLAERPNLGTVLFTVDASGELVSQTPRGESEGIASRTLAAGPDDNVFAGTLRRNNEDGRQTIVVMLRRGPAATQWSEYSFDSPWVWHGIETLVVDAAGNVLISGPVVDSDNQWRLAHVSFDAQGAVRWATLLDGETLPTSAKVYARDGFDGAGNAYVVATVRGSNGPWDDDLLITKYDPSGQPLWNTRFDVDPTDTDASYKPGTVLADEGGVFACGYGWFSSAGAGIISLRLDENGNLLWHDFLNRGNYYPQARRNPLDGGYYVGTTITVGGSHPGRDVLLLRYGPDGQRIFDRQFDTGLDTYDSLTGFVVDPDGQVVLGGNSTESSSEYRIRAARVSAAGDVIWDRQYTWTGSDPSIWCRAFLADAQGRATFVALVNDSHTGRDAALMTLDAGGDVTRTVQLNSTRPSVDSFCYGSVADLDGNLYLALDSRQYPDTGGWVVVKYDASGLEQWRRRVSEWGSRPTVMAIDAWQNITVAGSVADNGSSDTGDILVARWRPDGSEVWRAVYDGPTGQRDYANGMAMSYMGDVYMSGQTVVGDQGLPLLIKFDYNGHYQWDQLAIFGGRLMKVASDNNLLLITSSGLTCMSPDGWVQWTSPLPASNGCLPSLYDMALDRFGNVVLVGRGCFTSTSNALAVIKYSPTGELRWVSQPGDIEGAIGQHVVLDRPGNILVAGTQSVSQGGYPPEQFLVTALVSPQGATRWTARHYLGPAAFSGATDLARDDQWAYVMADYENALLFRYDLEGNLAWKAEYEETDASRQRAFRLSLDSDGRPNVTSTITSVDNNSDIVTVCYGAAPPPCGGTAACRAADVNADCVVDLADLFIVLTNFGLTHRGSISPADGDMNFDGVTDINDLVSVLGAFGQACE